MPPRPPSRPMPIWSLFSASSAGRHVERGVAAATGERLGGDAVGFIAVGLDGTVMIDGHVAGDAAVAAAAADRDTVSTVALRDQAEADVEAGVAAAAPIDWARRPSLPSPSVRMSPVWRTLTSPPSPAAAVAADCEDARDIVAVLRL